ncbi:MAG: Citronellyl-CoA dehydrogenase @ Acyl-CoA dehydrogenase, Mycobacterial subgroup FadE13, partial [uncultured Blastococcus sp.]
DVHHPCRHERRPLDHPGADRPAPPRARLRRPRGGTEHGRLGGGRRAPPRAAPPRRGHRTARRGVPRGGRWGRRRRCGLGHHHRGTAARGRVHRPGGGPVHPRHRPATHRGPRLGRPGGALRPADPRRGDDRLPGRQRARRRLRRGRSAHAGGAGRRQLRRERVEDLHHERGARRLRDHRGPYRRRGLRRRVAAGDRQGDAGLHGVTPPGQDGLALLGHRGAVLRRRPGARREPRGPGEQRLRADHAAVPGRAARPGGAGLRHRRPVPGARAGLGQGAPRVRPAAVVAPGDPAQARRDGPPGRRGAHVHALGDAALAGRRGRGDRGVDGEEHGRLRVRPRGGRGGADLRRNGLPARVRGRAALPRRADPRHRRRHERDHERGDRQAARCL